MHALDWANGSLCWQLYVPQTVYSHNMTSWRAREARMYHWLCLILLKLSELTKHNRSNHIYQQHCYNMIYTIVPSITYKLSPSPHIRMWKKYFTYTINFRIISHTCMCKWHLIWSDFAPKLINFDGFVWEFQQFVQRRSKSPRFSNFLGFRNEYFWNFQKMIFGKLEKRIKKVETN